MTRFAVYVQRQSTNVYTLMFLPDTREDAESARIDYAESRPYCATVIVEDGPAEPCTLADASLCGPGIGEPHYHPEGRPFPASLTAGQLPYGTDTTHFRALRP